jgi:hypothetical protein
MAIDNGGDEDVRDVLCDFCERTLDWKPEGSAGSSEFVTFEWFRQHVKVCSAFDAQE